MFAYHSSTVCFMQRQPLGNCLVAKELIQFSVSMFLDDASCMVKWIQLLPEFRNEQAARRVEAVMKLFSEHVDEGNVEDINKLQLSAALGKEELVGQFIACMSKSECVCHNQ